jgi:uncharacterized damage-inducible protein DinB
MEILDLLRKEYDQEVTMTRKMLERVPEDKWDWKQHEKSMTMKQLTAHLAEIAEWPSIGLHTEVLDFAATPYVPTPINSVPELLSLLDKSIASGKASLQNAKEEDLLPTWTMKYGDQVLLSMSKYEMIRHSLSQQSHHRAQLGVYLRLLDIPIPGTYGPSADEQNF